jgi:DEAD/DEAH box helicase domain-containing protein
LRSNKRNTTKSLTEFLTGLEADPPVAKALVHHERLSASPAAYGHPATPLPLALESALNETGIKSLYRHQCQALELSRSGRNVVVITPTASGKSLLYNLPVIESLISSEGGHALYLFPLKALENDQATKLRALIDGAGWSDKLGVGVYDGDTPTNERARIRANPPSVLITNPDMLNLGMLAHHAAWETFMAGLKFVVIDELHVYRGVFGSHILHVLRRLNRICAHYGSTPRYIGTSATIAGAQELAEELTGKPFSLVERSGAPTPERHFLFFNPVESYLTFALKLFVQALRAGLKAIIFTKARRTTELLHRWMNEAFRDLSGRVSSYRAGFLPEERREIERKLLEGKLDGVISTSALELGIDIGGLDVCILVGYPGTVATTWQRAGRVGRGKSPAAICLVAGQDQLDQYFMRNPSDFFARSVERAIVDTTNEHIARPHVLSAAQELPLRGDDPMLGDPVTMGIIESLEAEGQLLQSASGGEWFSSQRTPQRRIDIRAAGEAYSIEIEGKGGSLGNVSGRSALAECHPGAIYLHRSEQYLVTELDREARKASVRPSDVQYYTVALFEKETEILEVRKTREMAQGKVSLVKLKVTEQLMGYQRRRTHTQELISVHDLEFPPSSYQTIGLAIAVPEGAQKIASAEGWHFRGGIHGAEHAMLALAPMFALCDRNDLGGYSQAMHPQVKGPAVFLYDGHPGGIGLSARLYEVFEELVRRTHKLVSECPCEIGCPSCIHSPKCGHGNVPLDKRAAVLTFEALLGLKDMPEVGRMGVPARVEEDSTDKRTGTPVRPAASTGGDARSTTKPFPPPLPPPPPPQPTPSAWPESLTGVVFDLETQHSADDVGGWTNVRKMKLAFASIYRFPQGEWLDFWEQDAAKLIEVLEAADLVIGFNSVRFDYEVMRGYKGFDETKLKSYDILTEVTRVLGHRLSLNAVASATLGAHKSADGLQSLEWWRKGEFEKVAVYCRQDVEVTRDVFFHILEKGYVLFEKKGIGLVRAPIKFRI